MSKRSSNLEKMLDFHVGRILLFCFSLIKIRRNLPREIKRIGLFKEAALGDTTLLSGIVKDIITTYPDRQVFFICSSSNEILAENFIDKKNTLKIPIKNPLKSIWMLRKLKLDVLVDLGAWPRINAIISLFSGAKHIVGFKTPSQFRHYCYDQTVEHSNECHEVDNYRNLCKLINLHSTSLPTLKTISELPEEFISKKYVIFHPWPSGFRSELRKWPDHNWVKLTHWCNEKRLSVYFSGAPSEKSLNHQLIGDREALNLAGKYSFQELITIISKASCVVSVNTGIMHMAAALNVPTIGLSGPTNSKRWGPIGEKSISIVPTVEGCGYLNLGFEYEGRRIDCMEHIPVELVMDALTKVMSSREDG